MANPFYTQPADGAQAAVIASPHVPLALTSSKIRASFMSLSFKLSQQDFSFHETLTSIQGSSLWYIQFIRNNHFQPLPKSTPSNA